MTVLLTHQAVAKLNTVVGTAQDVTRFDEAYIECLHGFNEATANTNPQSFLIQTSFSTSGTVDWVTAVEHITATGTPAIEAFLALEPIGESSIEVTDASESASGNLIYLRDTVVADSEWALVQEVDTTGTEFVILADGITTAHAATTTSIFTLAEKFRARIIVRGTRRVRVVYLNEGGTAADTHIKVDGEFLRYR